MKLIRVIQSKIVKKDNKYQVQSEKGKNLGTYDTKEEAEKRLKQVEMFKHMKKKSNIFTYTDLYKDFIIKLKNNEFDINIDDIDYEYLYVTVDTEDGEIKIVIRIDFELDGYHKAYEGKSSPYLATTPEDYYGEDAYYEDFFLNKITVTTIGDRKVNIDIPIDSPFGEHLYKSIKDYYKYELEY